MTSRRQMVFLAGLAVLGGMLLGGCAQVDEKTISLLPPDQGAQLRVWSKNHSVVFDPRLHSMDTCPFLTYLPAATFLRGEDWAKFAWKFYGAKHREEGNCLCNSELTDYPPTLTHTGK